MQDGITVFPGEDPRIVEAVMTRAGCSPLRQLGEVKLEFEEFIRTGVLTGDERQHLPNIYADEPRVGMTGPRKQVGKPDDVRKFRVGELWRMHIESHGKVFTGYPHDAVVRILSLFTIDDDYFYWMPHVGVLPNPGDFNSDVRLDLKELSAYGHVNLKVVNPDHLRRVGGIVGGSGSSR